jgi:hypothetical protein
MQLDVSFHIYISLEIRVAIAKITTYVISVKILTTWEGLQENM